MTMASHDDRHHPNVLKKDDRFVARCSCGWTATTSTTLDALIAFDDHEVHVTE